MNLSNLGYPENSPNVYICGLTAAGKSTHAHLLAGRFGMQYISASQILLNLLGKSPLQSRNHWITDEARFNWSQENYLKVDAELLAVEQRCQLAVFDTLTMPWLRRKDGFSVWLESTFESRVMKSAVSHQVDWTSSKADISRLILRKDTEQGAMLEKLYNFHPNGDPSRFDLVLDISGAIEAATWRASLVSIQRVDDILTAAVGWFLTQDEAYRQHFFSATERSSRVQVIQIPAGLARRS